MAACNPLLYHFFKFPWCMPGPDVSLCDECGFNRVVVVVYIKDSKCDWFKQKLDFLGHVISADGISMDTQKVQSIIDWPQLTSSSEVASFLGLAGYYRQFIHQYSHIAAPLTELLKKETKFIWGPEQQAAYIRVSVAVVRTLRQQQRKRQDSKLGAEAATAPGASGLPPALAPLPWGRLLRAPLTAQGLLIGAPGEAEHGGVHGQRC